jgi:hypothetical protein
MFSSVFLLSAVTEATFYNEANEKNVVISDLGVPTLPGSTAIAEVFNNDRSLSESTTAESELHKLEAELFPVSPHTKRASMQILPAQKDARLKALRGCKALSELGENSAEIVRRCMASEGFQTRANTQSGGDQPLSDDPTYKPATSVHLNYGPDLGNIADFTKVKSFELTNSVIVHSSARATFFSILRFAPAGYAGIQQLEDGTKKAIFSLWTKNEIVPELMKPGYGARVENFDGEGVGKKIMMDFVWNTGDEITQKVEVGTTWCGEGLKDECWLVSCYIWKKNDSPKLMGQFRFSKDYGPVMHNAGFSSFVEDFDRTLDGGIKS